MIHAEEDVMSMTGTSTAWSWRIGLKLLRTRRLRDWNG
jgi:hypothetical protein